MDGIHSSMGWVGNSLKLEKAQKRRGKDGIRYRVGRSIGGCEEGREEEGKSGFHVANDSLVGKERSAERNLEFGQRFYTLDNPDVLRPTAKLIEGHGG
jgi:hypothetical protein